MFMWHRHGGWLGVTFAHACSKERGGVGCVIVVREYGLGSVVVGSEAMHSCSLAARGSHMLSYTANISLSRLWSPSEVFASVICLQYSSVSLSSRSLSSIEQAQPPSLKMLSQYWYKIHKFRLHTIMETEHSEQATTAA